VAVREGASMTMDEVRAMQALGGEVLNAECEDPPKKP
jgi:hypothetical protein